MTGQSTSIAPPSAANEESLALLVRRMAIGDDHALEAVYERTVARVHALARHILRNEADAEEVVCDTYLQAWESAARFDAARGNASAWLMTITRSRALDQVRRRRARENAHAGQALDPSVPGRDDAPDPMDVVEADSVASRALARLTPEQRRVVALAYFNGLTQEEVAEASGLPLGTVKSHMRRGLETLREHFAGE
jgi:RNA polymerase sigma-70 factor (ECF subfamily)